MRTAAAKRRRTQKAYRRGLVNRAYRRSEQDWIRELRARAYERFKEIGFPDKSQEAWKYVDLKAVLDGFFERPRASCLKAWNPNTLKSRGYDDGGHHLVFVNGFHAVKLSRSNHLGPGVLLRTLKESFLSHPDLVRAYLGRHVQNDKDSFAVINSFSFEDGVFLYVPPGTSVEKPIHLWSIGQAEDSMAPVFYPRNLVVMDAGSKAQLVLHTLGAAGGRYLMNQVFEAHLSPGAALSVVLVQESSEQGFEFLSTHASLEEESSLEMISLATGGFSRNYTSVGLRGARASCFLRGLGILSGRAQVYHHTLMRHASSATVSRQFQKNVLSGKSHSEFSGLVHVEREGQKADSDQLNRNLLLSDEAQAHSRPQLKIDADDVKCSHGSTVGQLMDEELFYMRSRGLPQEDARSLLVCGFAEEVVDSVGPAFLKHHLETLIHRKLQDVMKTAGG